MFIASAGLMGKPGGIVPFRIDRAVSWAASMWTYQPGMVTPLKRNRAGECGRVLDKP
ncbi:MAG: hypothetical protein BWY91_03158 [bacterium ADurb.BinA028]|nr:MAG: hypothetical protein BWY91_03158 [bacterium ADurb.BinA028]